MARVLIAKHISNSVSTYKTLTEASEDTLIEKNKIKHAIATGIEVDGFYFFWTNTSSKVDKSVNQLDINGNIIATYKNQYEATVITGINNINKAINGMLKTAGGYRWELAKNDIHKKNSKIVHISIHGKIIGIYGTLGKVATILNCDIKNAAHIINHLLETEHGFFINATDLDTHVIEFQNGLITNIYLRQVYASRELGVRPQNIYNACYNGSILNGKSYVTLKSLIRDYEIIS